MRIGKWSIGAAPVVAAAMGLMSADAAENYKAYPGGACVRTSGSAYERYFGTVFNNSATSELNVFCPLVRDGGYILTARVNVFDRNTTIDVSCTLWHEQERGNNVFLVSSTVTSSGFADTYKSLKFSGPGFPVGGYYYVTCSIPRADNGQVSHIASLTVIETDPEVG